MEFKDKDRLSELLKWPSMQSYILQSDARGDWTDFASFVKLLPVKFRGEKAMEDLITCLSGIDLYPFNLIKKQDAHFLALGVLLSLRSNGFFIVKETEKDPWLEVAANLGLEVWKPLGQYAFHYIILDADGAINIQKVLEGMSPRTRETFNIDKDPNMWEEITDTLIKKNI